MRAQVCGYASSPLSRVLKLKPSTSRTKRHGLRKMNVNCVRHALYCRRRHSGCKGFLLKAVRADSFGGYFFEAEKAFEAEGNLVVYLELTRHDEDIAHFAVMNDARFRTQLGGAGFISKPNIQLGNGTCSSFAKCHVNQDMRHVLARHIVAQLGVVSYLHDSSDSVSSFRNASLLGSTVW